LFFLQSKTTQNMSRVTAPAVKIIRALSFTTAARAAEPLLDVLADNAEASC
jgi:hypothetical protein